MKKSFLLLAAVAVASSPVCTRAQAVRTTEITRSCFSARESYFHANLEAAKKNYLVTLRSDNDGLVISGLAQVTMMRHYVPAENLDAIQAEVNSLAVRGRTPEIRYKAYLSSLVFSSPELFPQETIWQSESPDQLFSSLAGTLQRELLSLNGHKYVRPE